MKKILTDEEILAKKEAKRLYDIEYRKQNKDKINKKNSDWAKNNPDKIKKTYKNNYIKNSDKIKIKRKKYCENNKEKVKIYNDKYRSDHSDEIKILQDKWRNDNSEYYKEYYKKNKNKIYEYIKNKRSDDVLYKLKGNLRSLIRHALKRNNIKKTSKTYKILGCSFEDFKIHLESKFEPWMNWDSYGLYNGELNYGWDIDHITPNSSATNEVELIKLNYYTNLQPLCSYINRVIKKDNIN